MTKRFSHLRWLPLVALSGAVLLQAGVASAGTLGGIAGTVTDAKTGVPLAGVHLQITSPSQSVNATTDAHGHYIVLSLQPDNYTVTAVKAGYDAQSWAGESVYADQTQQYDLQMDPSAAPSQ
jgi:hypothetical protein